MAEIAVQACNAIHRIQRQISWPPQSASRHLIKRKSRGHLPPNATLADYNGIIHALVSDPNAVVYAYWHGTTMYVAVVGLSQAETWLVMFDLSGVMESAFVVERPQHYLNRPVFQRLGSLQEVAG